MKFLWTAEELVWVKREKRHNFLLKIFLPLFLKTFYSELFRQNQIVDPVLSDSAAPLNEAFIVHDCAETGTIVMLPHAALFATALFIQDNSSFLTERQRDRETSQVLEKWDSCNLWKCLAVRHKPHAYTLYFQKQCSVNEVRLTTIYNHKHIFVFMGI